MDSLPTADEMLAQVPTETMQSFLTSLRHAYPIGSTCILALDGHISSLDLQRPISLSRGDVLEIQGPAASGKSHLLYHLLATCILPSAYSSVEIRGWECAAVLFDTDGKFSVKRFSHLLLFRLSQILRDAKNTSLPAIEDQALEDMVGQCLSRLHIFRPSSSAHLATTLMHLPDYHSTHPSLRSYEIGLLAIDSLSAFYWNDRFLGEQWRTTSGLTAPGNAISTEPVSPLRQVIVALQSVRVMRGPLTVLTNWGLNSLGRAVDVGEQQYPLYKQHLHPFPSPFDAADADALPSRTHREPTQLQSSVGPARSHVAQGDSAHEASSSSETGQGFSVTHHITLYPASLALLDIEGDTVRSSVIAQNGVHRGLIRTPASAHATRFAFSIVEDDVAFKTSDEM